MTRRGMTGPQVAALCRQFEAGGVVVWLDGGWCVDALVGRETRAHGDVDLVVEERAVAALRALLEEEGFADAPQDDTRPWNFVLAHPDGRRVDVHVVVFDEAGNGVYGPPENGEAYPARALEGRGVVAGLAVRCLTAEYQIGNRAGYPIRDSDRHDVRLLAAHFGLELPDECRSAQAGRRTV